MTARTNPQAPAGRKTIKIQQLVPFCACVHSSQMNRSFGTKCAIVVVVVVSTVSNKTGLWSPCSFLRRIFHSFGFTRSPGHGYIVFSIRCCFFWVFLPSVPAFPPLGTGPEVPTSFITRRLPPLILYSLTSKEHEGCFPTWSRHRRAVQPPLLRSARAYLPSVLYIINGWVKIKYTCAFPTVVFLPGLYFWRRRTQKVRPCQL